jgi:hypothetical protein
VTLSSIGVPIALGEKVEKCLMSRLTMGQLFDFLGAT